MRERLTPRRIASLAPTGERIAIFDAVVPGLILRVTPAGVKTFLRLVPRERPRAALHHTRSVSGGGTGGGP